MDFADILRSKCQALHPPCIVSHACTHRRMWFVMTCLGWSRQMGCWLGIGAVLSLCRGLKYQG